MRFVAPMTMAYAYLALTGLCAISLALAHSRASIVGQVIAVAATIGYLWFQSAPIAPGTIPRAWRVAVGGCGVLLVSTCILAIRRRLGDHESVDWIWPAFWGIGFAVTALELSTGKRFTGDEQSVALPRDGTPKDDSPR